MGLQNDYDVEVDLKINSKQAKAQLLSDYKRIKTEIEGDLIKARIVADSKDLEKIKKDIANLTPEQLQDISINIQGGTLGKQLKDLDTYIGKSGEEIGANFRKSIQDGIGNNQLNISEVIKKYIGDNAYVTTGNIQKTLSLMMKEISEPINTDNYLDIVQRAEKLEQLWKTVKEVQKDKPGVYKDLGLNQNEIFKTITDQYTQIGNIFSDKSFVNTFKSQINNIFETIQSDLQHTLEAIIKQKMVGLGGKGDGTGVGTGTGTGEGTGTGRSSNGTRTGGATIPTKPNGQNFVDDLQDQVKGKKVNVDVSPTVNAKAEKEYDNIFKKWQKDNFSYLDNKPELGMLFNTSTGDAYEILNDKVGALPQKLIEEAFKNIDFKSDSFIHTHPNELFGALSFDDIAVAIKHQVEGIIYEYVASINDISVLDISKFTADDLQKISDFMKNVGESFEEVGEWATPEEFAYDKNVKKNISKYYEIALKQLQQSLLEQGIDENTINNIIKESRNDLKTIDADDLADWDSCYDAIRGIFTHYIEQYVESLSVKLKNSKGKEMQQSKADIIGDLAASSISGYSVQEVIEESLINAIKQVRPDINIDDVYKKLNWEDYYKTGFSFKDNKEKVKTEGEIELTVDKQKLRKQVEDALNDSFEITVKSKTKSIRDDINEQLTEPFDVKIKPGEDTRDKIEGELTSEPFYIQVGPTDELRDLVDGDLTGEPFNINIEPNNTLIDAIQEMLNKNKFDIDIGVGNFTSENGQSNNVSSPSKLIIDMMEADSFMVDNYNGDNPALGPLKERAMFFNSKTGEHTNPFIFDRHGSITDARILDSLSDEEREQKGFDVGMHSHPDKYAMFSIGTSGDFLSWMNDYNKGIKTGIVAAQKEIQLFDIEGFLKEYGDKFGKFLSDGYFLRSTDQPFLEKFDNELAGEIDRLQIHVDEMLKLKNFKEFRKMPLDTFFEQKNVGDGFNTDYLRLALKKHAKENGFVDLLNRPSISKDFWAYAEKNKDTTNSMRSMIQRYVSHVFKELEGTTVGGKTVSADDWNKYRLDPDVYSNWYSGLLNDNNMELWQVAYREAAMRMFKKEGIDLEKYTKIMSPEDFEHFYDNANDSTGYLPKPTNLNFDTASQELQDALNNSSYSINSFTIDDPAIVSELVQAAIDTGTPYIINGIEIPPDSNLSQQIQDIIDSKKYSIMFDYGEESIFDNARSGNVKEFYEKYGKPTDAIENGQFEDYRALLNEIGGEFVSLNSEDPFEIDLEFVKSLVSQLDLSEDKLLVIKSLFEEIQDLTSDTEVTGFNKFFNINKSKNKLQDILRITDDGYDISEDELREARKKAIQKYKEKQTQTEPISIELTIDENSNLPDQIKQLIKNNEPYYVNIQLDPSSTLFKDIQNAIKNTNVEGNAGNNQSSISSGNASQDAASVPQEEHIIQQGAEGAAQAVDNLGRKIDETFAKKVSGTALVDDMQRIITLFHHSDKEFDSFDLSKLDKNTRLGRGAYFGFDKTNMADFLGQDIMSQWYANVQNIFDTTKGNETQLDASQIENFIQTYLSSESEEYISNFRQSLQKGGLEAIRAIKTEANKSNDVEMFKNMMGSLGYDAILGETSGNYGGVQQTLRELNVLDPSKIFKIDASQFSELERLNSEIETAKEFIQDYKQQIEEFKAAAQDMSKSPEERAYFQEMIDNGFKDENEQIRLQEERLQQLLEARQKLADAIIIQAKPSNETPVSTSIEEQSSTPSTVAFQQEQQTVEQAVQAERTNLDGLIGKLEDVVLAINQKTDAFKNEAQTVSGVVEGEINSLDALLGTLVMIKDELNKIGEANGFKDFFKTISENQEALKAFAEILSKTKKEQDEAAQKVKDANNKEYDDQEMQRRAQLIEEEGERIIASSDGEEIIANVKRMYDSHDNLVEEVITIEKQIHDENQKLISRQQDIYNIKWDKRGNLLYSSKMENEDFKTAQKQEEREYKEREKNDKKMAEKRIAANNKIYEDYQKQQRQQEENNAKATAKKYQDNLKAISNLGVAKSEAKTLDAKRLKSGDILDNQIEEANKRVQESAEKAKQAMQDLFKMYRSGDITKEQFQGALQKYKSKEVQEGSQKSIDNYYNSVIQTYKKLSEKAVKDGALLSPSELQRLEEAKEIIKEINDAKEKGETLSQAELNVLQKTAEIDKNIKEQNNKQPSPTTPSTDDEVQNAIKNFEMLKQHAKEYYEEKAKVDKDGEGAASPKYKKWAEAFEQATKAAEKYGSTVKELAEAQDGFNNAINAVQKTKDKQADDHATQQMDAAIKKIRDRYSNIDDSDQDKWSEQYSGLGKALDNIINQAQLSGKTAQDIENLNNSANKLFSTFQRFQKLPNGDFVQQAFGDIDEAKSYFTSLVNEYNTTLKGVSGSNNLDANNIAKWSATVRDAQGNVTQLGAVWDATINQMVITSKQLPSQLVGFAGIIDGVKKRLKELATYWTARLFDPSDIVRYVKQVTNIVKQYDDALTQIRMVSQQSAQSLKEFQQDVFQNASDVGTTALTIEQSTASWLRLGKSMEEAKEASKASAWLVNVSEFDSIEDATTSLVSMKQAFSDLDYEDFIDKLNGVGDSFSSSTKALAEGMQNVSSVLQVAGNDIDQSLALLAAANSLAEIYRNIFLRTYLIALIA